MPSFKHRQAQVKLAIGRSEAQSNRDITKALKIIRDENNACWEHALKNLGVDERTIRAAYKEVREQESTVDDRIARVESGLIR